MCLRGSMVLGCGLPELVGWWDASGSRRRISVSQGIISWSTSTTGARAVFRDRVSPPSPPQRFDDIGVRFGCC